MRNMRGTAVVLALALTMPAGRASCTPGEGAAGARASRPLPRAAAWPLRLRGGADADASPAGWGSFSDAEAASDRWDEEGGSAGEGPAPPPLGERPCSVCCGTGVVGAPGGGSAAPRGGESAESRARAAELRAKGLERQLRELEEQFCQAEAELVQSRAAAAAVSPRLCVSACVLPACACRAHIPAIRKHMQARTHARVHTHTHTHTLHAYTCELPPAYRHTGASPSKRTHVCR